MIEVSDVELIAWALKHDMTICFNREDGDSRFLDCAEAAFYCCHLCKKSETKMNPTNKSQTAIMHSSCKHSGCSIYDKINPCYTAKFVHSKITLEE